jgi:Group II intron, maturase-specific domain
MVGDLGVRAPGELVVAIQGNRKVPFRETGTERSGDRIRVSTNRNRIGDTAEQGERADNRKGSRPRLRRCRSGDRAETAASPAPPPAYSFWVAAGGAVKRRVAPKALEEMKQRVRQITGRNGGRGMERVTKRLGAYLRGWKEYFRLSDTPRVFLDLDSWIHRRLRMLQRKQWKRGPDCLSRTDCSGTTRVAGPQRYWFRRTLVVGSSPRRDAHSSAGRVLQAARGTPARYTNLNSLNRRMRTRMSGGVGGE